MVPRGDVSVRVAAQAPAEATPNPMPPGAELAGLAGAHAVPFQASSWPVLAPPCAMPASASWPVTSLVPRLIARATASQSPLVTCGKPLPVGAPRLPKASWPVMLPPPRFMAVAAVPGPEKITGPVPPVTYAPGPCRSAPTVVAPDAWIVAHLNGRPLEFIQSGPEQRVRS